MPNERWKDPEESVSDYLEKALENIKGKFNLPKGGITGILVLVAVLFVAFTSFYTVEPTEQAVLLRFGRYVSTEPPGLHLKFPFGIDRAIKVKTKVVLQQEFGFRSAGTTGSRTAYSGRRFDEESLILTGDLNVADAEWIVQYRVAEPRKYLFHARNVLKNLRDVSQSMMRRVIGDRLVGEVLTVGRVEVAAEAHKLMQEVLDRYDIGLRIVAVKLQDVNPPEKVKPAFNEVNAAKQEQEKVINEAEQYYNKIIPEARGKAERTIRDAEGYASALVNTAKGDAARFNSVLRAYRKAPGITKTRLYLETMEVLYSRFTELTIVDRGVKGILPVFTTTGASATGGPSK